MKKRIKNFWQKPHLLLGNSFSKNGKEVKRRLQMSLKKKSSQLKITYGFLGLMVCIFVASAFKINIQTIPTLIEQGFTSTQKSFEQKIDKKIPSIKIKAKSKIDTIDYIFITDLEGNTLNPEKTVTEESILINIFSDSQEIKVLKTLVSHFYRGKEQKGVGFTGNRLDIDQNFEMHKNGKIKIKILEIKINGVVKNISKQPYSIIISIGNQPSEKQENQVFLRVPNFPLYKTAEHDIFLKISEEYEDEFLEYKTDNGKIEKFRDKGRIKIYPKTLGELNLEVYHKQKLITQKLFRVVPVPPPSIFLADSSGRKLNLERPIKNKYLNILRVRVFAEAMFKAVLPEEAQYEIAFVELTQFRGGRSINSLKIRERNEDGDILIDIGSLDLKRGDGFNLKIVRVNRIRKDGQLEVAPILRPNIQFTINSLE